MSDAGEALLAIYERALPQVYGYLLSRCGQAELAEDLTSEAFLAAVDAVRRQPPPPVNAAWLVGVARHKLVDHWRRQEREQRGLQTVAREQSEQHDPWDAQLNAVNAHTTLQRLTPDHRAALTLRYVDDLPVAEVAEHLGRSIEAAEGVLIRAKAAFRREYGSQEERDA